LVPNHYTTIDIAEKFKRFYIDYVPRQQNAHVDAFVSLAASLALSAGALEKVLVYSHNMYCPKFIFEENHTTRGDLQDEKVSKISTGSKLRD